MLAYYVFPFQSLPYHLQHTIKYNVSTYRNATSIKFFRFLNNFKQDFIFVIQKLITRQRYTAMNTKPPHFYFFSFLNPVTSLGIKNT